MCSWRQLLFFSHILINLAVLTIAQNDLHSGCVDSGYYSNNSTYQTNLDTLLSSLPSHINQYGFYSSSVGKNSDRIDAIVLCRGDVELDICRSCINDSTSKLLQVCPNYKEAIGGYDYCMIRYRSPNITMVRPSVYVYNVNNVSSVDQFKLALASLFERLRLQAAAGGPLLKFATGNQTGPDFQTIYALVQCTPDLSEDGCINCLDEAIGEIPKCCDGKRGGRVLKAVCNLHYETNYRFFNATRAVALPPSPGKKDNTIRTVIIVVLTITSVIILIFCIYILLRKRKQRKLRKPRQEDESVDEISSVEALQYDFGTISIATDDFSDANKLGEGGFGAVYRGRLQNGQEIAVKRLSKNSGQGEIEFKNEVMLVAKLQHRNLVTLLGFCLEGTEKLLIYEFVPNSSLDHFIFDPIKRTHLDWDSRYRIIEGTARGLLYLHEDSRLRIIHRDLKASNILLDAEMNPKIADFGMARLFVLDETQGSTNRIVGTYGYMAPEYAMHGRFSVKSDVFSFGVLVLEIVSGQKNKTFQNGENVEDLLSYAWKGWRDGTATNLIDPTLRSSSGSRLEMMRCIHMGLLCVQENVAQRPTMASVVLMLNNFSATLPVPSEPAFFQHSSINPEMPLLPEYSSGAMESLNEASITELYPR